MSPHDMLVWWVMHFGTRAISSWELEEAGFNPSFFASFREIRDARWVAYDDSILTRKVWQLTEAGLAVLNEQMDKCPDVQTN